ncbi:MAG: glycerol-3-phosphate dehydrogenase/oxidase [Verrucomicrobiales bacterium]|nr:glycerol-3-phosphate dehydrogenase/oxidase [Verrucomicrobiales bacterium]
MPSDTRQPYTGSKARRGRVTAALQNETHDILVVGGGIVGAGIARDAALRGLKVALVEQHDFAFGTSSRTSRLLHGGLRYLAQGRIKLVHDASVEKKIIHRIAPHIAAPLPFIFPAYADNPNWPLWQLKLGVKVYDLLCSGKNFASSTWLTPAEVLAAVPALRGDKLLGAVRYYDAFTNDARLTLDTLRSAEAAGAVVLNYCRFVAAERADVWVCDVEDRLTQQRFVVRAKTVVNATGPWGDKLAHSGLKLRLTKGIHLVVHRSRLAVPEAVVMTESKRILFAIPWGERTILGTTDTDYTGSLEEVFATDDEIQYVLSVANLFFPHSKLTHADVISTWAGLRPLLADTAGNPSDISRAHQICNPVPGWWDVAGGKLTTYRLMAEETVDRIIREQGWHAKACTTASAPLLPAGQTAGVSGLVPPEFTRELVEHFVTHEWAVHLDDVMLRRAGWHYYHPDAEDRARAVAEWMADLLGWDRSELAHQLQRYIAAGRKTAMQSGVSARTPNTRATDPDPARDVKPNPIRSDI